MSKEEKEKLDKNLNEFFGKNSLKKGNEMESVKEWISTGSLTLDLATGKGIPKEGRCTCIIGKESSSKTTLLLHIIAEEHKKNPKNICFFGDVEGTFDAEYASKIGVDLNRLHLLNIGGYLKDQGIKDREILWNIS